VFEQMVLSVWNAGLRDKLSLYLAGCAYAFAPGRISLYQIVWGGPMAR
jgi:hypothetical protein